MGNRYASGKNAIGECDQCGFRYKLRELRSLIVKGHDTNVKVCRACWVPDQPQLMLGVFPVDDPQAVQNPRPDFTGYDQSRAWIQPVTTVHAAVVLGWVTVLASTGTEYHIDLEDGGFFLLENGDYILMES